MSAELAASRVLPTLRGFVRKAVIPLLAMAVLAATVPTDAGAGERAAIPIGQVEGQGRLARLACLGCVVGLLAFGSSVVSALALVAAYPEVAIACVSICSDVISGLR